MDRNKFNKKVRKLGSDFFSNLHPKKQKNKVLVEKKTNGRTKYCTGNTI